MSWIDCWPSHAAKVRTVAEPRREAAASAPARTPYMCMCMRGATAVASA